MQTSKVQTTFDISRIREDFPLLRRDMNHHPIVFLDSAASSQKPESVINAIAHYYRYQHANVHRGVYGLSQEATDAFEHGREITRQFLNASSTEEIIFVRGTTEAINLVAASFGKEYLQAGDEVLISAMEHHSNIVPWQIACAQFGAKLKVIPINQQGELRMDAYQDLLTDKTKIVAIAHVSNTLGTINPVKDIISLAHEHNIPVLLDGAQATPHLKIDVQDLDVDFYAFSGHKVYGPTGIGVLYGKKTWLDSMPPYQGGGEMIQSVSFAKTTYNELPYKFEAGTPNIAGVVGLGAALQYVENIGQNNIARHEAELLAHATHRLQTIEGLKIIGTADNKASVISFIIDNLHPFDIGTILDKQGIAIRTGHHCTQPLMDFYQIPGTVRASFAMYNNKNDVDRLINGVNRALQMLRI